mmetsp:Transcript_101168/g.151539  ORF Transcript_101168/g.151539 Transcript_101168/m.151539 type:complete len:522 (-) Transcript_101168:198-1763(-)|eukprot:CAMPEP_0117006024 /NCGR_PEP_ID=MMETSP0472-20121206/6407_1 /TAXON_ID=693140 ORGANISM="Tiarina fusus, Strain LIS" /NCGR_SAMPLE_ID=MMETSP0472 /ASSEMBLY_ACC=CAM_ASM_000603 /LENGTH=521 /DNA_ID=CAMNT_0004707385 /DNA_START=95 /DNA_END=1660 /DNA_ORIENTATION=+
MSTNLSSPDGKIYKSHEGEHHGDFSDASLKITKSTYIYAICAAVNSCNLGYDVGVNTHAGGLIQSDLGLTEVQRELFVGSLNFWSIFGSLFAHWICDKYGRRLSFRVAAISFIIGLVIMSLAGGYTVLMIGRVFVGLGVGFGLAIDPLYIAEVSPAAHRGEMVTWSEMALNLGIVLGFFSGIVFYGVEDSLTWRLMFISGAILPIVMIILVRTVMPESPRWLVDQGRDDEAKTILRTIYPEGFNVDPVVSDIKEALERERIAEQAMGWNVILFPTPAIRRMLIVGVGIAVAQQAVGIDAIQYYLIDVLEQSGIESDKGRLGVLMMLGVLKLTFIFIGGKLFDRKGRRPMFFVSLAGLVGALIMISFTFLGDQNKGTNFTVIGLALYMCFFSLGMGPGAWLIPSEVFASSIRAKSMSVATFFNRITATLMASTFLTTANAIGWAGFFIMLAAIAALVAAFIFFFLPETKGRSLEDMSIYFAEITNDSSLLDAEAKIIQEREAKGNVEMISALPPDSTEGQMT